ncbi:hypothetical protein B566_EDAN011400 [Ephemera danica]|nr:hypothetical protein B566_EDAN011400 [Ephemera danica]
MAGREESSPDSDDDRKEGFNAGMDRLASPIHPDVTYNWVDITLEFHEEVKELELGELLHDDMFGLLEAMSAIEMMDPKMDAGMLCNRGSKKALSFDQAVEDLLPPEQIGIIDSTLACVVSWLEGHSLAQTVFTNLYLHKPYQIEDRPIKAFSISILKIVDLIKEFVTKAMVFEEEDFQPVVYGYRLVPDVTETRAIGMLREVEEDLNRRLKTLRSKAAEEKTAEMQAEFTRLLFQALSCLGRRDQVLDQQRYLSGCIEVLQVLQKSVHRGVQPESQPGSSRGDHPTIMGFDPLVNQRLLPPTFPRYTKIKRREKALEYFEELLTRLKIVCRVTTFTSFHCALDFFIEFSRTSPCILSRSILQLLYLPHCNRILGVHNFTDAKEYVDSFFGHCVRPLGSLIQICGHNRARQRDKLAHLLEEFATLQDEAERVDAFLHNLSLKSDSPRPHLACFGTWILYHTLRVMIMYLLSGFELELYSKHEYHYIFWYLYEFLYGWLVSALSRADNFLLEQDVALENAKGRSSKKNKPKKKIKVRPYGKEITLSQAMQNMCGGYYKALIGFRLDGKIKLPHFDNERVRYEHRFAPFANLMTPPPMHYQEFVDMTSLQRYKQPPTSAQLYASGCEHFHQARSLLEMIVNPDQEVGDLLKVAKTNFVVLKLLAGGHKKDSTLPVEFDFSGHQHFPIIKLP